MDHESPTTLTYPSADGHSTVHALLWEPRSGEPRAILQIVHGMSEHVARYDNLARHFTELGFVVAGEDHVGHGQTAASAKELGHMPAKGGVAILLADVDHLRQELQARYPHLPYVLYGHSMGSFIVRNYLAEHGEGVGAAIISGTNNPPAWLSTMGRGLALALAALRGETHRSRLVDTMAIGPYRSSVPDPRTDFDWLSTDDAVVDAYVADGRCGTMFTVGGYATLLTLTRNQVDPARVARIPEAVPILVVAGEQDPVGGNGKEVGEAAELLASRGSARVDLKLYPAMRHEIHNEVGGDAVIDDMTRWVEDVLAASPRRS